MPAPMQGEMQATIHRFKFGEFEIATILDSKVTREGLHPSHGGEHPASEMEALAAANRITKARSDYLSAAMDLEWQMPNLKWMIGSKCDLSGPLERAETNIKAVAGNPQAPYKLPT